MAFVGFANAQMVKPTELVANYSSFNGQTISVADFTGSIRGMGAISVDATPVKLNTTNVLNGPSSKSPTKGSNTLPSSKAKFCKILKGYKIVMPISEKIPVRELKIFYKTEDMLFP